MIPNLVFAQEVINESRTVSCVNKENIYKLLGEFDEVPFIRALNSPVLGVPIFNPLVIFVNQKIVLKEFISSVDSTPKLREFYNTKVEEIKEEINTISKKVTDKAIQIKLNEVTNLLSPLGKISNVGNDDLVNLLQYYELLEELVKANG